MLPAPPCLWPAAPPSAACPPARAMGSGQSATEVGGFRIFKVNPGSPAFEAGLEVFFDFIVDIGGTKMDSNQNNFFAKIQEAENTRTKLVVYNIRTHTSRDVYVMPRKWGGAGLLGAVVRYDALDNADNQGIRVLDVFPNSPAKQAGLIPYKDYLLGTTEVMFRDLDELVEIVNLSLGKKTQIYVYNSDTEAIREVTIVPNNNWGGDGSIGADIRTGLLHRIPAPRRPFNVAKAAQPAHVLQPALYPAPAPAAAPAVAAPAPAPAAVPSTAPVAPSAGAQAEAAGVAVPGSAATSGRADVAAPGVLADPSPAMPPSAAAPATAAQSSTAPPVEGPSAAVVYEASSVLAGLSRAETESPERFAEASVFEPSTPAKVVPPKVPPSTPMNIVEAVQADVVQAMSPSVVHIPPDMETRPGTVSDSPLPAHQLGTPSPSQAVPGVIFESPSPAPGVIYETEAQQAAAALL